MLHYSTKESNYSTRDCCWAFPSCFRTERGVGGSLLPVFLLNVASFDASISEMRQMVYLLKYQIHSRHTKRETALVQLL